jgi:hypothetical protein
MNRPYRNETGHRVRDLIAQHWDDFEGLGVLAYEIQFRELIKEDQRGAVIERLVELGLARGEPNDENPGFDFPSTDIQRARRLAASALGDLDWQETGLLRLSGYRVGKKRGKSVPERRRILNYIFLEDDLRDVTDSEYARSWGRPKSSDRLQKLCETLAAFIRNAKRHPFDMAKAIADWEHDLEYLRATFYERWGQFPWPDLDV